MSPKKKKSKDNGTPTRKSTVTSPGDLIPLGQLKGQAQTAGEGVFDKFQKDPEEEGQDEEEEVVVVGPEPEEEVLEEEEGYMGSIDSLQAGQSGATSSSIQSSSRNHSMATRGGVGLGSMSSLRYQSTSCSTCSVLRDELENTKLKFEGLMTTQNEWEAGKMHRRLALLHDELEEKDGELEKMRLDMEILDQKLIDEIEKRAEITAANESVQGELEELTQSLFEEANTLVANEARQRHGAQEKQQVLAKQLQDVNMHLQLEQAQSRELRMRIAQFEQEREEAKKNASLLSTAADQPKVPFARLSIPGRFSATGQNQIEQQKSLTNMNTDDLIDPFLFEQFVELIEKAPRVKMTKIHDIPFMHSSLEDDVIPCLRFGGNPRTSTRKFIDAIVANTCFIELMTEDQIQELEERDERIRRSSLIAAESAASSKNTTPTMSLFNKTVLERITNALTAQSPGLGESSEQEGCATCGRMESYQFRFKISDVQQDVWYPICSDCRFRLLSVLDFYQFIRNMRQGLFSTRPQRDLYLETLCYKRVMFFARIGCGGLKHVDSLFQILDPVRPDSSILDSIEDLRESVAFAEGEGEGGDELEEEAE